MRLAVPHAIANMVKEDHRIIDNKITVRTKKRNFARVKYQVRQENEIDLVEEKKKMWKGIS